MSLQDIPPSSFLPEALQKADTRLFHQVNGQWHNPFLDAVLPFLREPTFWMPFYFFLLLFVLINFKTKGIYWVIFVLLNAGLSDYLSSSIIKENIWRLRPCRDPALADHVRVLASYCPRSSSFTSSHAVNHFAAAAFIFSTFRRGISNRWIFIFLWAAIICYAQVYVGVHYPLDVTAGAVVGVIIGFSTAALYNSKFKLAVSSNGSV